jgi:hypothetical protein
MGAMIVAGLLAGCSNPPFDDPFANYARRSDTISPTAGNAKAANAAVQTIDPWPRYVYNTHIPGDGQRLSEAVNRYHTNTPGPKPLPPIYDITTSSSGGGGS